MILLLLLFACEEEPNDTGSDDTAAVESTEQMGANFFCG